MRVLSENYKQAILFEIQEEVGSELPDDDYVCSVEYDNSTWEMILEETLPVEDDGKYSFGGHVFRVFNEDNEDECFYVLQGFSRSGSYFSEYYYDFEKPCLCVKKTKMVEYWECE